MLLPVTKASEIADVKQDARWLVEELWLEEAVGFIGGEPKSCKTTMAAELAVAVSSGRPCLRRYPVARPGKVLMFAAEDSLHDIKRRLQAICAASEIRLEDCDISLITVPVLRLDIKEHRSDLAETVKDLRPRLLVLDPFIRMHCVDENHSGEVAPLLAYLRALQKINSTAIAVVHHARKRAGKSRAGQNLRGSSELHAWYDSHLYMTRKDVGHLSLDVEHRSESSKDGIRLRITEIDAALSLDVIEDDENDDVIITTGADLQEKILEALAKATSPMSMNAIRKSCRIRKSAVSPALAKLEEIGLVQRASSGYEAVN